MIYIDRVDDEPSCAFCASPADRSIEGERMRIEVCRDCSWSIWHDLKDLHSKDHVPAKAVAS